MNQETKREHGFQTRLTTALAFSSVTPEDLSRGRSRLFDQLKDEEVELEEAQRKSATRTTPRSATQERTKKYLPDFLDLAIKMPTGGWIPKRDRRVMPEEGEMKNGT